MNAGRPTTLLHDRPRPLRVLVLVSATGGGLTNLLDLSSMRPDLLDIVLVASDRPQCGALDLARASGVEAWPGRFREECGSPSECLTEVDHAVYRQRAEAFHDRLSARIGFYEEREGDLDLVVLAYHRWVHGELLDRFRLRMVNQHPGDLRSVRPDGRRTLIGLDPVAVALRRGDQSTRTTTFLVDEHHDGGAILATGPAVAYDGPRPPTARDIQAHEQRQKALSDGPALRWTVTAMAESRISIDLNDRHRDGSAVVHVDGQRQELGGHVL